MGYAAREDFRFLEGAQPDMLFAKVETVDPIFHIALDAYANGGFSTPRTSRENSAGPRRMKSILGLVAAVVVAAAIAFAWWYSLRPGAGWMDAQWLFLAALPYNWIVLQVVGQSNFAPDAPSQVIAALLSETALAYLAGAVLEAVARGILRLGRLIIRA